MNASGTAANELVFGWEKPGRGKWTLAGFLFGSFFLHAFGFYLFQIVYPPAVALLPPPGRVSLIAADTDEGRQTQKRSSCRRFSTRPPTSRGNRR
jgi:hypothetical protein